MVTIDVASTNPSTLYKARLITTPDSNNIYSNLTFLSRSSSNSFMVDKLALLYDSTSSYPIR